MAIDPMVMGDIKLGVTANRVDIRDAIRDRLFSLQLSDGAGFESDQLDMVLIDDNPDEPIKVPPKGAEIEITLGYQLYYREMGLFVVDELELAGWPLALVIRARAAPFNNTKYGKTGLQSQKNRSWEKGTKLAVMLDTLAKEHGMKSAISASMAGIELPHFDQKEESDINFLLRIARKYDGIVKPAGGYLTITKKGESISASGAPLPRVKVVREDIVDFRWNSQARETSGTVIAYYKTTKKSARNELTIGEGEPVKRIGTNYPTKDMALAAAKALMAKNKRNEVTLNITLMGNPEIMAEMVMEIENVHEVLNGEWLVKTCRHRIGEDGYKTDVELEVPNKDEEPDVKERVLKAPKVGSKEDPNDDYNAGVISLPPLKK